MKFGWQQVRTYVGRVVPVSNGNIAQAWGRLNGLLKKNRVKQTVRKNMYFERPGQKKHRLAHERTIRRIRNEVAEKFKAADYLQRRGF